MSEAAHVSAHYLRSAFVVDGAAFPFVWKARRYGLSSLSERRVYWELRLVLQSIYPSSFANTKLSRLLRDQCSAWQVAFDQAGLEWEDSLVLSATAAVSRNVEHPCTSQEYQVSNSALLVLLLLYCTWLRGKQSQDRPRALAIAWGAACFPPDFAVSLPPTTSQVKCWRRALNSAPRSELASMCSTS